MFSLSLLVTCHHNLFKQISVRSSTQFYLRFNLHITRSPGFGSTTYNSFAHFRLGFPPAPELLSLNLAIYRNSQAHSTKGTPSPYYYGFDLLWVYGFRFSFTPLTGVLFTFPSRYFCTIGRISYLALDRGRPRFRQGFSCPAVLRYCQQSRNHFAYGDFTLSVRLSQNLSAIVTFSQTLPFTGRQPYNPTRRWFRLLQFRSPLLPESLLMSVPRVLRWFSSPSFASAPYVFRYG